MKMFVNYGLFVNFYTGNEHPNLPWHIKHALNLVQSPEVNEAISGNVIIGGAVTTLPGFTERLEKEVNLQFSSDESNSTSNSGIFSGKVLKLEI